MARIVWITGAGKGLGRALALLLAGRGDVVAASARTASDLATLQAEAAGGRFAAYPLDTTDERATLEIVETIERELGPIDQAVLNAGTHLPVAADALATEPFRRLVETNLMGTVNGLAALAPRMVARRRGRIAVVASVAGYRGLPSASAYGATKAGLINMAEALRPDLMRHGVVLQVINPGFVRTPLTDRNDFPMPFLVEAEDAARRIAAGLATDRFEIAFPRRFVLMLKLLRLLPYPLFFALTRRMLRP